MTVKRKRFNEFPDGSGSLSGDDIFLFMDDPSGSGITKKISLNQIGETIGSDADTGDISFSGIQIIGSGTASGDGNGYGTIELVPDNNLYNNHQYVVVDPTAPNHIHLRAGGPQDNSNAELIVGGEKNNLRINDQSPLARMQTESLITLNTYYLTSSEFSSAVWETVDGDHRVVINDPSPIAYDAVWGLNTISLFSVVDNSNNYYELTYSGSSTPGGSSPIIVYVNQAPPTSPTTLNQLTFEIRGNRQTYLEANGSDIRISAADDVRIFSRDIFRLYNYSSSDPIEIVTDYDGNEYWWRFEADGNLQIPGNILLNNGTSVSVGTYDNNTGGQNGVSLNCAVGYELNWQGGRLKSTYDNGQYTSPLNLDSPLSAGSGNFTALTINDIDVSISGHIHDDRYYTESEIDTLLSDTISNANITNLKNNLYVVPSGNDATANGSPEKPFGSIQAAHDYALANFNYYTTVVINIAPHDGVYPDDNGCYIENLVLTRKRTVLKGMGGDHRNKSVTIRGNIQVNIPTTSVTSPLNDIYGFEGLVLRSKSDSLSPILTIGGSTNGYTVALSNCFLWTEANAKIIEVTNTTSASAVLKAINTRFQADSSAQVALELSNIRAEMFNVDIFAGTNSAIKSTNSTIVLTEANITGTGSNLIEVVSQKSSFAAGNIGLAMDNSRLSNLTVNSNGINLASSTRALLSNVLLTISPGTGNAVAGSVGSQLLYKNIIGYPNFNNSISSNVNVISLPYIGDNGITKSSIGLGNVDNTSDTNKPVSTATQSALNLKAPINNPTFTGNAQFTTVIGQPANFVFSSSNSLDSLQLRNVFFQVFDVNSNIRFVINPQSGQVTTGIWNANTIDIAYGGTGATTAAAARTNLGAAPLNSPVLALGTLTGSNAINFSSDSLVQTLTLNGTDVTFTKGTGWPTTNVMGDIILRITVTSATTITWTIVSDWFNQPADGISAPLSVGTHLFLLRAIGSSIIEGHYIGSKTN